MNAQLNESDSIKFQFRSSLSGFYQQGNVRILSIRTKAECTVRIHEDFVFKTQNSGLYQAFSTFKADNDLFSRNYFYYKPDNKLYPFSIAYISGNFRRKITNRYFVGSGITYQLINKENNLLKISCSVVYEKTKYITQSFNFERYNGLNTLIVWRPTFYLAGHTYLNEKNIRLTYDAYYQPSFSEINNYRTQFDVGLEVALWKGLGCILLYSFTHENVVPLEVISNDSILTFGFNINFQKN